MDSLIYVKSLKCKSVVSNDCLDFYAVIGAAKRKKKKSCCTNIFVCIHFLRFVYASALFTLFSVDSECCEDSPFVVSLCLQSSRWYFMDLLFLFFFFSSSLLLKTMNVNFFCPPHATAQRMHNSIFLSGVTMNFIK